MINKIVALDKELLLPSDIQVEENNMEQLMSIINDFDPETAKSLEGIPVAYRIEQTKVVIYRTDAHFG